MTTGGGTNVAHFNALHVLASAERAARAANVEAATLLLARAQVHATLAVATELNALRSKFREASEGGEGQ